MSDILLQELNNLDIDWIVTHAERQQLAAGDILIFPEQEIDSLYLLLDGTLMMSAPCSGREFALLKRGELIGMDGLFDIAAVSTTSAKTEAVVLRLPRELLRTKLNDEVDFAAHIYRAIARLMSQHIRDRFEQAHGDQQLLYQSGQLVQEALYVFSELHDSDIDWMMSAGSVTSLDDGQVLLNQGRPVDALYIVLAGQLAIATTDKPYDPFAGCSKTLEHRAEAFSPLAVISRGGLPGIISFLDFKPLPVRIHTTRPSKVLAIPRPQILIKLQEDLDFAARFYRVIAAQVANLLLSITATECRSGTSDHVNPSPDMTGELNLEELRQVSQGGKKFDWMLKRLQINAGT